MSRVTLKPYAFHHMQNVVVHFVNRAGSAERELPIRRRRARCAEPPTKARTLERPGFGRGFCASRTTPPDWKFLCSGAGTIDEVNDDILHVMECIGFEGDATHLAVIL